MIAIISCSKSKKNFPCAAKEMYSESTLFNKTLNFCLSKKYEHIFIASAKYGILKLDQQIEPYDKTLNKANEKGGEEWAAKVVNQLSALNLLSENFDFYTGVNYVSPLSAILKINSPMKGLGIGQRLKFLS